MLKGRGSVGLEGTEPFIGLSDLLCQAFDHLPGIRQSPAHDLNFPVTTGAESEANGASRSPHRLSGGRKRPVMIVCRPKALIPLYLEGR